MMADELAGWKDRSVLVLSPTPSHPKDFGNRKRVYEICTRLQDAGSEIHFLHYASEADWRDGFPIDQQRQMTAAWHSYTTIFPSRSIHPPPIEGLDHDIDEWWDPSIAQTLSWMFARNRFDAFLVNYTWLSRALDYAPPRTLKILDTHDRFSGRRELLEANGLAAEFFHTDLEGETVALNRADIVWAIKDQEAAFFRRLTSKRVATVPHADARMEPARVKSAVDAPLRLGIVGARNNINRANITEFIETATSIFRRWLAPVEVLIAGSVCSIIPDHVYSPFFTLVGRVENITDFYNSVDAIVVPMRFSTGLKIKVAEALSFGLPVISHVHAFEGFESFHHGQVLPDFDHLARFCVDVAYDRSVLNALRSASVRSQGALEVAVARGLSETAAELERHRPRLLVLAGRKALQASTADEVWLRGSLPFLTAAGAVTIVVDGTPAMAGAAPMMRLVQDAGASLRFFSTNDPCGGSTDLITTEAVKRLAEEATLTLLLDSVVLEFTDLEVAEMHVAVVADILGFGRRPLADTRLRAILARVAELTLLASDVVSVDHLRLAGRRAAYGVVPLFSWSAMDDLPVRRSAASEPPHIAILSPYSDNVFSAQGLAQMIKTLTPRRTTVVVRLDPLQENERDPEQFLREWLAGAPVDMFVDLSPGAPATAAIREIGRRNGVAFVDRIEPGAADSYMSHLGFEPLVRQVLYALSLDDGGEWTPPVNVGPEYDNEAGWSWLWRRLAESPRKGPREPPYDVPEFAADQR